MSPRLKKVSKFAFTGRGNAALHARRTPVASNATVNEAHSA
jgi:hypothetical protein